MNQPMSETAYDIIARIVAKAPIWLRHDLTAKDLATRSRAEESLAAMIADALGQGECDKRTDTPVNS